MFKVRGGPRLAPERGFRAAVCVWERAALRGRQAVLGLALSAAASGRGRGAAS